MGRPRVRKISSPTRYLVDTWARERPDLDPDEYLFLIHIMRLGRLIDRLHDRFARQEFGLSGADVMLLIILRRTQASHAPRPAELAESQMVTSGAITKQLVRLETMGLVERRPNTGKGGGIALFATDAGLALANRAMTDLVGASPLGAMQRSASAEDRRRLVALCEDLLLEFEHALV